MANFKGKSLSNVRVYVADRPIFPIKNKQGELNPDPSKQQYWMNIVAANDMFEKEEDFIDRPSLGFARAYEGKDGETQYSREMPYAKSQLDKMAVAVGLNPEDYDVNDLRGQTFTADLMTSSNKTYKGLIVNTSKPLGVAAPLNKEAHDANTLRAAELRKELQVQAETQPEVESQQAVVATPETSMDEPEL